MHVNSWKASQWLDIHTAAYPFPFFFKTDVLCDFQFPFGGVIVNGLFISQAVHFSGCSSWSDLKGNSLPFLPGFPCFKNARTWAEDNTTGVLWFWAYLFYCGLEAPSQSVGHPSPM